MISPTLVARALPIQEMPGLVCFISLATLTGWRGFFIKFGKKVAPNLQIVAYLQYGSNKAKAKS